MKSHGVSISSLTAVVLCCAAVGVEGLYQEDAGRWDWQKSNFRNVRDVCVTGKKVYVAAEGVVGAVAGKSGNLVWRRKVPGDVLYVRKTGGLVIAVTGDSVHAFSDEGALMWEQGLPSPSTNTPIGISGETGEEWPCVLTINPTTATLTALPIQIDGASLKFGSPVAAPLPGTLPYAQIASIKVTDGSVHILTVTSVLHELQLASSQWMLAKELPEKSSDWAFGPGDAATITAYSKTLQKCFEKNMADTRPAASGCLLAGGALDTSAHSASMGSVADVWSSMQGTGQRTVVKFETGDLALFQNGELTWTRDDGLALVESVKAYDIPDEESDDQVHTPIEEYMHILHHQWSEVQRMLSDAPRIVNGVMDYVVHRKLPQPVEQDNARDIGFGLQKTLVMASPKAVFSVSSLNGSLAWKVAASSLLTADEVRINKVFITLATATQHSHPHLYVWATGVTGGVEKDYMMELSAANGEKISMKEISAGIEVVFETANYFRNGYTTLLVVKKDATAEVYPAEHVRSENFDDGAMRYHTFTKSGGSAAGYHITHDMKVVKTWSTNLLSAPEEVVVTSSLETYNPKAFISTDVIHVHGNHSTGKNEVLSKYVNKNAFLVVTAVPAGILKEDEQDTEQATGLKRDGYLV